MLWHVTATHSPDNCPLYDAELRARVRESTDQAQGMAQELGLTVHFALSCGPAHTFYYLLEGDDYGAVQRWLVTSPVKQQYTIVPVVTVPDLMRSLMQG